MKQVLIAFAVVVLLGFAVTVRADEAQQQTTSKETATGNPPAGWSKNLERAQTDAANGNPKAEFYLGWVYEEGKGIVQDFAKAKEWYLKAAEQGNTDAQTNLGDT